MSAIALSALTVVIAGGVTVLVRSTGGARRRRLHPTAVIAVGVVTAAAISLDGFTTASLLT